MKLKELVCVKEEHTDKKELLLVERNEISRKIWFGDSTDTYLLNKELSDPELEILNNYIKDNPDADIEPAGIENILRNELLILDAEVNYTDTYEDEEEQPALFFYDGKFEMTNLITYPASWVYTYWDGNNHRNIDLEEPDLSLTWNKNDIEWYSLDKFDGRNHCFNNNPACHCKVGKFKDDYLIWEYSDFQGSNSYITIADYNDLCDFCEENEVELPPELDCKLEESIEQLKNGKGVQHELIED